MNREPKRWLDDESAPEGVRALLRGSQRALPIDAGARARVGKLAYATYDGVAISEQPIILAPVGIVSVWLRNAAARLISRIL